MYIFHSLLLFSLHHVYHRVFSEALISENILRFSCLSITSLVHKYHFKHKFAHKRHKMFAKTQLGFAWIQQPYPSTACACDCNGTEMSLQIFCAGSLTFYRQHYPVNCGQSSHTHPGSDCTRFLVKCWSDLHTF